MLFLSCSKKKKGGAGRGREIIRFYNPEDFLVLPWECTSSLFSVSLLTAVTKDIPVNLFLTVHLEFLHVFVVLWRTFRALCCRESLEKDYFSVFFTRRSVCQAQLLVQ